MNTLSSPHCPECGALLTAEAPDGLCPACLMRQAMFPTNGAETIGGDPPALEAVAEAFPQWEILGLIGRGGMGAVYRVRQPRLNRLAALKLIPAVRAETDPAFAGRFEREGELLARLHHPNIVTVHDSGRAGGFYYLLMEYVDGVNLRQAMRAGQFTPRQALAVVPEICRALQYAHDEGVLHRDIKPENILLDSKGRVKLADFGIAKLIRSSPGEDTIGSEALPSSDTLTQMGAAPGTPRYMAPEQVAHPQEVDHRADIYSLGVVFYELLTGELPAASFAPPSQVVSVDQRVDAIVRQALEKERELRQRSAAEMQTQVESVAGGFTEQEIVEAAAHLRQRFFEYKSARRIFGLPLLHVVAGRDPQTGRIAEARGVFAFGEVAKGIFAVGGRAVGVAAFGGMATGVVSAGGISIGVFSMGGLALGLVLAVGGMAAGFFAAGGMALGWNAVGGMAAGWNASGGTVFAHLGMGGKVFATQVIRDLSLAPEGLRWLARFPSWMPFTALLWIPPVVAAVLVPLWARNKSGTPDNFRADSADKVPLAPTLWWHMILITLLFPVLFTALPRYMPIFRDMGALAPPALRFLTNFGSWGYLLLPVALGLTAACGFLARATGGRSGLRWWSGVFVTLIAAMMVIPMVQVSMALRSSVSVLAPPAPQVNAAVLAQARQLYDVTRKRYEAGIANFLEVIDARYEMETAEAGDDAEKRISARRQWAADRVRLLEERYKAGMESSVDLEKARLERDKAEGEWQALQSGGQ